MRSTFVFLLLLLCAFPLVAAEPLDLRLERKNNYLVVHGNFPGGRIETNYLEAYCRAGSTAQNWQKTVIKHRNERLDAGDDPQVIRLRDVLTDGVEVEHVIRAGDDEVSFELTARNPTATASAAHWAQPCMRVDRFTGAGNKDAMELVPAYARQCFLFIEGEPQFLPTQPWASKALYTPGQVYCPREVDRNDVNPRPLSELVPSSGLCGCVSADKSFLLATAWDSYQEVFQGVAACMHCDFRLGGLAPGETKQFRGRLYVLPNDLKALAARYEKDFGRRP